MKKLLMKIVFMYFMAVIICPCVTADEKFDLDMMKIPGKNIEMLRTEVTQELYESVMGVNPSYFCHDNKKVDKDVLKKLNKSTSDYPVEQISWYDAIYFCNKLSVKKGLQPVYAVDGETDVRKWDYKPHKQNKIFGDIAQSISADGYRLPTVEEWLYAAKGGQDYRYSGSDKLDSVVWYSDNSGAVTHPVAQKKPNGYGLYDMSGNVEEWCWDSDAIYFRFFCGGSCFNYGNYCKVNSINENGAFGRFIHVGFRIVRTIK